MAKIRAYKLAEELGIERTELVEKAASVGVLLKSPMAPIDEAEAALLREKFGGARERDGVVTERRVERRDGAAVIRRRRREAEPEPVPEPAPLLAVPVAPAPRVTTPAEPAPAPPPEPGEEPIAAEAPRLPAVPEPQPEPIAAEAQGEAAAAGARGGEGRTQADGPDRSGGRQRKLVREVVNLREQERLARQAIGRAPLRRQVTLEPRSLLSPRRRRRDAPAKPVRAGAPREEKRTLRVEGSIGVGELARMMGAKAPEVQRRLMALGTMASINQSIEVETARAVAREFGFEVQDVAFREEAFLEAVGTEQAAADRVARPPIITVMGHVDHGKTSLLDAIRRTNVVAGEAGGITQHIGAYQVEVGGSKLSFIDTPGHAAFTAMRARGAQVTDLVVLVIAATEGIMPQTVEAIDHAKAAGVPIVVAINKCDLPAANPQLTRQRLMEHGLVPEEFGGEVLCVDVSAVKGTGLDKLLETIGLQAEVLELRANPQLRASGVVLEANLDKGRGPVATVLVQQGTLRRGDAVVVGTCAGRVRVMEDENGKRLEEAGPSTPVQLIGLAGVPDAGEAFHAVESERLAKQIVDHRLAERRGEPAEARPAVSLEDFFAQAEGGGIRELRVVIKADVQGSVEALRDALLKLSTDAVKVDVILSGVGAVTESDIMLAKASDAIVIGFHVRPDPAARRAAEGQGVDVRSYRIIYEVTDDVKKAMAGLLPPTISEEFQGRAEVRQTFTVPKVGTAAGSYVAEGRVRRGASCRLLRDGVQIYQGRIGSLKRFKEDVREVAAGFECGIGIEGYNDVKVGDVIETYVVEEKPAVLE